MVHLKLEMTNQATCHPWLLNQEVSPRAFCLKLNYNSLCAITFRGTKTVLPGTGWWRITNAILSQGQWIHPRYHGDKFISKSQPSSVMQTIPGPGKSVLAVQVLPHCPTMLLTERILRTSPAFSRVNIQRIGAPFQVYCHELVFWGQENNGS